MSPRPRYHKLAPDKKKAILDAAMEEFARHGFDDASYNKIIERAGVSKGAMYYYFDDKADLYITVFSEVQAKMGEALGSMQPVGTKEEFWASLGRATERMIGMFTASPHLVGLVRSAWKLRFKGQDPALAQLMEYARSWHAELLRAGQAVGAVRDDLPFELMVNLVTAVDEAGDLWIMEHSDMQYETLLTWGRRFVDILYRLLSPDVVGYSARG